MGWMSPSQSRFTLSSSEIMQRFNRFQRSSSSRPHTHIRRELRFLRHFFIPRLRSLPLSLSLSIIAITLLGALLIAPAQALLAKVTPSAPQLGDTLSVTFQSNGGTEPKVRLGAKTYPAFQLNANQYRTLLPTTPLDKPGPLAIQIADGADAQTLNVILKNAGFQRKVFGYRQEKTPIQTSTNSIEWTNLRKLRLLKNTGAALYESPIQDRLQPSMACVAITMACLLKTTFTEGSIMLGRTARPLLLRQQGE